VIGAFISLWRRAPLWRWTVLATALAMAMTLAFPPSWPTASVATPPPRETPAPPQAAPVKPNPVVPPNSTNLPTAGAAYSSRLPLGAQSVPLPPGHWVALAINTSTGSTAAPPSVNVFLALILGNRLTAAALISGSTAPDPNEAGFPAPLETQIPSFYYRRILSAADHGALDLWVCGNTRPGQWTDPLRQAALGVIRQQNLSLPDHLDSAVFRLADKRNWLSANFMFTDPTGATDPAQPWTEAAVLSDTGSLSHLERVRRWGKAWHEITRRGFANALIPGEEAHIAPP
jgi:hypothetical protein